MSGQAGRDLRGRLPYAVNNSEIDAFESRRRRSNHRIVRSDEAEDAVTAAGMAWNIGRRGGALRIVHAELEGRGAARLGDR